MIILKPEKGFVIPVVYMSNDKLYSGNLENISFQQESKVINLNEEKIRNSLFKDDVIYDNGELREDEIVRDRLLVDDDDVKEENKNVIAAIVDKNSNNNENGRGILVFDDVDDIEIDEKKSVELEQARSNFRKAIEVEIEKVGKLVLDDDEIKVDSKISVNSSKADKNADETDTLEENIAADNTREKDMEEYKDNPNMEKEIESEIVKESEDKK